ncbi:phycobilisome protein [Leptolyngbya sp. FACHB-261]|uniref:phycobilisome protein n=1 Tax=Leptolyngbya sp. FACHB-261 TaxID=2692806 RepID=UPI00168819BB|nr:phycobilisome protein [Leptolyngbya sp. FACHB-261]MBD2104921.1 phycobilisome protein [Leptolyngbya sp. FACHB-261]
MISRISILVRETEGRYLYDSELSVYTRYLSELKARIAVYQKLQALETEVIAEIEGKLRHQDSSLFLYGGEDVSSKWKRDTLLTYRAMAKAVLLDDVDYLKQSFLLWMQTMMRAFGALRSCAETYMLMGTVLRRRLSSPEVAILMPVLQVIQQTLAE